MYLDVQKQLKYQFITVITYSSNFNLTHLFQVHPFSTSCFQGVEKWCIGNK